MKSSTVDGFLGALDGSSNLFHGTADEARIAPRNFNPGWITTEYNNAFSPSTFFTEGNVETSVYAPTLYQELRHGQFFGTSGAASGQIQPFTW